MFRLFLPLVLVAALAACAVDPSLPPPSAEPPVFDHLIVPGKRVGPIALGMTKDQLFAAMGLPANTYVGGKEVFEHSYQRRDLGNNSFTEGLRVSVGKRSSRVWTVDVDEGNEGYRTKEGVAVGATERQVRELLGAPAKVVLKTAHSFDMYCYPGLRVNFLGGVVRIISVTPWDCSML